MERIIKIFGLILALGLVLTFTACKGGRGGEEDEGVPEIPAGVLKGIVVFEAQSISLPLSYGTVKSAQYIEEEPVPGARVEVEGINFSDVTDQEGKFEIQNLPPGTFKVSAKLDNDGDGVPEYSGVEKVTLPEDKGQEINLRLGSGEISGRVTLDGAQTGNIGILVFIPGSSIVACTADDGSYLLEGVPCPVASITVAAAKESYSVEQVGVEVPSCGVVVEGVSLDLKWVGPAPGPGTGRVEGKAFLLGESSHSGITISLNSGDTEVTAEDGSYAFEELPSGLYHLTASMPGYNPVVFNNIAIPPGGTFLVPDLYLVSDADPDCDGDGIPNSQDPDDDNDGYSDEEELQYGSDTCDPNSMPLGDITGTVKEFGTETPIFGALVGVAGTDKVAITDAAGQFELLDVHAGDRTLVAIMSGYESGFTVVNVIAGATVPATIYLTGSPDNTEPTAEIWSPSSGFVVTEGNTINFAGLVGDMEDNPQDLYVYWISSIDGLLNSDPADVAGFVGFATDQLSTGTHQIMLWVSDSGGLSGEDTIAISVNPAEPPAEPILCLSPLSLDFGSALTTLSLFLDNCGSGTLNWMLSSNRTWLSASPASGALTEGSTIIEVTVNRDGLQYLTDYSGALSFYSDGGDNLVSVDMYVPCGDEDGDGYTDHICGGEDCDDSNSDIYPGATIVVTITFPVDGVTIIAGDITVTGTADNHITSVSLDSTQGAWSDPNPAVSAGAWSSTLQGLVAGIVTITATGTDDCGNIGSDSVTVPVIPPGCSISIITPTTGCTGDPVTITGTNFGATQGSVIFDPGSVTATVTFWSDTSITVETPGGDFSNVTLTPEAGSSCSLTGNYSYDDDPPWVNITFPADGAIFCTTTVVIEGSCNDVGWSGIVSCVIEVDGVTGDMTDGTETIVVPGTGVYTAALTGVDDCGYGATTTISFEVDATPPAVEIASPADGAIFCTTTVVIVGSCTDVGFGIDTCIIEVDGITGDMSDGTETIVVPGSGVYTATLTGADNCLAYCYYGYEATTTISFEVDITPPSIIITDPIGGQILSNVDDVDAGESGLQYDVVVNTDAEDGQTVIVSANGSPAGVGIVTLSSAAIRVSLPNGSLSLVASVNDRAGNTASSPPVIVTVAFVVEGPEISITSPAPGACINTMPFIVAGTFSNFNAPMVEVFVNGVTAITTVLSPISGSYTATTILPGGPQTITAVASDGVYMATDIITVYVDLTPPLVTIDSPTAGVCINNSIMVVSGTASDPVPSSGLPATITVGITGVGTVTTTIAVEGSWSATFTIPVSGPWTATASLQDLCGNPGSESVGFNVDIGSPVATVTAPIVNECITTTTVMVSATCSDDVGVIACEVTVEGFTWRGSPATFVLADGPHTAWARATDDCGNTGVSSLVPFMVDTTPPISTAVPSGGLYTTMVTVVLTATDTQDPSPDIYYDMNETGFFILYPGPFLISITTTLDFYAVDYCGNEAPISREVYTFTGAIVGITAPAPGECINTMPVTVAGTFGGFPGIAVVDVFVNGVNALESPPGSTTSGSYTATLTSTELPEGPQTITAVASDGVSTAVASITVVVDTISPVVAIVSPTGGGCIDTSTVCLGITISDGSLSCTMDGYGPIDPSVECFTGVADGTYTITCSAVDACGNVSLDIVGPVTVDASAPAINITQPLTGQTLTTDTVVVKFTADDFGSGSDTTSGVVVLSGYGSQPATYSAPTFTAVFTCVASGAYTATACVDDLCGNTGCASVSFSLDTTPPAISINITDPADGSVSGTGGFPYVSCNVTGTAEFAGLPYVISTIPLEASITINGVTVDPASLIVTVTQTTVGTRVQGTDQFAITYYGAIISSGTAGQTAPDPDPDNYTNLFTDNTATFLTVGVEPGDQLNVAGQTVIVLGVSDERNLYITTDSLPDNLSGESWSILEENTTGGNTGRISGYVEVPLPIFCNSDGLAEDVLIYTELDDTDPGTPPGTYASTITLQLAHFGADPVTVITAADATATVNICAWVDPCAVSITMPTETAICITAPTCGGLFGYDFDLTFDDAVVTFSAANAPTGPFAATEFVLPTSSNWGAGTLRINSNSGASPTSPAGFMKLAELVFDRTGVMGDFTDLPLELDDVLRNPPGNPLLYPYSFIERFIPDNPPCPQDRKQDGVVKILPPPPPPEITSVCDGTETSCDPAHIQTGVPAQMVIIGNNFDCSGGVTITFSSGNWSLATLGSCSDTRLEFTVITFGGLTNVTIENVATGMSDTCVGCAESP